MYMSVHSFDKQLFLAIHLFYFFSKNKYFINRTYKLLKDIKNDWGFIYKFLSVLYSKYCLFLF